MVVCYQQPQSANRRRISCAALQKAEQMLFHLTPWKQAKKAVLADIFPGSYNEDGRGEGDG